MQAWAQVAIVLCIVVLTVVLVPAIIALRRAGERAERVLAIVEQDLRPLTSRVQELLDELGHLSQGARGELKRVSDLTERVHDVVNGVGRVLTAVSGLTRAAQLVGVAAGIKTGLDVFLHRLRRQGGDDHE